MIEIKANFNSNNTIIATFDGPHNYSDEPLDLLLYDTDYSDSNIIGTNGIYRDNSNNYR